MIFSDNYDKFKNAQTIYNNEVKKNPILEELDNLTDFFGVNFENINETYLKIYDYLITQNTIKNVVKDYSLIQDDSEEGKHIIEELKKNTSASDSFLIAPSNLDISEKPCFSIDYHMGDCRSILKMTNNAMFSKFINANGDSSSNLCYQTRINEKLFVVVRENKTHKQGENFVDETNDFIVDLHTHAILYCRQNKLSFDLNSENVSNIVQVYFKQNGNYVLQQINKQPPVLSKLPKKALIFLPEKKSFNDYVDVSTIATSKVGINQSNVLNKNKFYRSLINSTTKNLNIVEAITFKNEGKSNLKL